MRTKQGFNIIWQYLKPHKKQVYFLSGLAVIGSAITAFVPYLYGYLVDVATQPVFSAYLIVAILIGWLALSLIQDWLDRYINTQGSFIGSEINNAMYLEAGSHLLELPLSFHKHKKIGRIMRQVHHGADYMDSIINSVIFSIGPSFLTVVAAIIIMTFIEWRLALLLIIILGAYTQTTLWKTKAIIKSHKKLNKTYEMAFGDFYDAVHNVQTVKSFTREELEKNKIEKQFLNRGDQAYKNFIIAWHNLSAWQKTIFSIGFVLIFGSAVMMLRQNIISVGQFVMFIGYVSLAYSPFGTLAQNYRMLQSGMTAIKRYLLLIKKKPEPYRSHKKQLNNIKGEIVFQHVYFSYDKGKKVLEQINLKANPGEIVAIVGESGVGKTTLVDLISGYYRPTQGKIMIDGHDVQNITLESLRKNIALVPQEVTLFNDTIKKNIAYGKLDATDAEIIQAAKIAHAHHFIQKFQKKYNQIVGERGIKLSTGQKQRVAIARAVLRNPKILILDEATSSLDSATERQVQLALDELMKNRTTFVIAHRLSTIQKAHKIIVLEKGRIIEEGDHQELINKGGVYHKLNKLQATYIK